MSQDRVDALRQALALSPENHTLRLLLAESLQAAGQAEAALDEYAAVQEAGQLPRASLLPVARAALEAERLELAGKLLEAARDAGVVEGVAEAQGKLDAKLAGRGVVRLVPRGPEKEEPSEGPPPERTGITFSDVGGLGEVKKVVHRTIVLPLRRPDLYQKYGRRAGGGVLLYGPPGCGKTLLARATAGECSLPFFNVRIEDVLDPWFGVSEKNLHQAFERARAQSPCVMFLDELDAMAYARRKQQGTAGRALVDQLLQELDSIGAENKGVLVLAATNAPWDVDDALKRPGRFDRLIFVPPPDEPARQQILEHLLSKRPAEKLDLKRLAQKTPLFSGADLVALVEQAVDAVIEEALDSGGEPPLTQRHLEAALTGLRPTTLEWLARARNYVEFANQDERYRDVAEFLRSKEARSWKD